ncbi:MAG: LuxR family transcriptional regulator [Sphingomonadales bacterium]|nr:LuxR family transcriptional regulator [Sphingomonadales bacterium]
MALTSTDETDLLLPLHFGLHEHARFSTFLARLRRRTGADYVSLHFRHGDAPMPEVRELFAGRNLREAALTLGIEDLHLLERIPYDRLRPGRVYAAAEFLDHQPDVRSRREAWLRQLGIGDERVVRVIDQDGVSAWLVMARTGECSAADSALLSSLAPYVAAALRSLVLIERQQIDLAMAGEGLARFGAGWLLLDRQARTVGCDPHAAGALRRATGHAPVPGERLRGLDVRVERLLIEQADLLALDRTAPPRAVMLALDPRLEVLLVAPPDLPTTALARPAMLALCRFDAAHAPGRAALFARTYALQTREGELAIRLSEGQSIAEAAAAMGLTLETARAYSKQLYAKLGLRGQAELVRCVYESCAALA